MRLLLDESLSHHTVAPLAEAGHDVIHVAELELLGAPDEAVLAAALARDRVLVTADTDFGTLLALAQDPWPSVLLLRVAGREATARAATIEAALAEVADALAAGALVVVEAGRFRIRDLPITGGQ